MTSQETKTVEVTFPIYASLNIPGSQEQAIKFTDFPCSVCFWFFWLILRSLDIESKNNYIFSHQKENTSIAILMGSLFQGTIIPFTYCTYGVNAEGYCLTTTSQSNLITFSRNNLWFNLTCRHIKLVLLIRTRLLIKQVELATGESYLEIQWQFYIFNKGSVILLQSRWCTEMWSNLTFINNWSVERDKGENWYWFSLPLIFGWVLKSK